MLKYFGNSSSDVSLVQESRVVCEDAETSAQKASKSSGWNLAIAAATITDAEGISAGTAVASRSFFRMVGKHLEFIPDCFRSRICCTHVGGFCRGGIRDISIYLWCSEGLSRRNLDLLQCVPR